MVRIVTLLMMLGSMFGLCERTNAQDSPAKPRGSVDLGMPESLFQGIPIAFRSGMSEPLLKIMKDSTGIGSTLHQLPDAMTLADRLHDGTIQFGIFQGHEFAWAKAKYPDLVPMMVAVPLQPVQAFCVVLWDCPAKNIGDLAKGSISLPPIHREFCAMFLAREQREHNLKGAGFINQRVGSTATEAIYDVIEGKSVCAVIDGSTLQFFAEVYPGPYKNLKILAQSEVFPNPCVAMKKNGIDPKKVEKIRTSLLQVQKLPGGNQFLATWKLKGIVPVPVDYEQSFKGLQERYPTPVSARALADR